MIKHVVMFKLHDYAEGAGKEENARKVKHQLNLLKSTLKIIRDLEVGINFHDDSRAADVVLTVTFDTKEDLENYRINPEHMKAAEFIMKVRREAWAVDYEL